MKKLVLFGAYGFHNLGDKLLADYYRSVLSSAFPNHFRCIVMAGHRCPADAGEAIYNRFQVLSLLTALSPGDLWIAGGGSLMQNRTSHRSLLFYISLLEFASLRGARIIMLGQGYGPIKGRFWQSMTRHALSQTEFIECRDFLTYQRLRSMDLKNTRIQRGIDPGWGIEVPHPIRRGRTLLLILKLSDYAKIPKILAALSHLGLNKKIISLDGREETGLRALCGDSFVGNAHDIDSFWSFLEDTGGILSSRLHGIILGALAGLPVIGLGDDPKITGVCHELGLAVNTLHSPEDYGALPRLVSKLDFNVGVSEQINLLRQQAHVAKVNTEVILRELGDCTECGCIF